MFGGNRPTASSGPFSTGGSSLFGGGTTQNTLGTTASALPNTGGGLFGGTFGQNTGTSNFTFGAANTAQPQTSSAFGTFGSNPGTSTGGLFGSTTQQNTGQQGFGGFGGGGTGLFGRPAATTGGFGASTASGSGTTSLFGTQNQTGMLGMGQQMPVPNGTTIKFNALAGRENVIKGGASSEINTKHHCLTAMKEYEAKSQEELRLDDYLVNRKSGTMSTTGGLFGSTQQNTGGGLFGSTTNQQQPGTSLGLFGNQQKTGTTGGLFGSTNTSTGGTGLFGSGAATSSTGLFGATNANKPGGLFGSQPAQSQSGGLFGSTNNTFGAGNTNTGGLFGNANQNKSAFGFGATTTTTSSLFNFGNTPAQNTTGGGLFGANNQNKSLFGNPTGATNFGAGTTNTTGGLFGNTQPAGATGGLFGAKPSTFGTTGGTLFGAQPAAGGLGQTGSLFGGNTLGAQPLGQPSLFGAGANTAAMQQPVQLTTDAATANAQHAMLQQQILALASNPYGDSPLFRNSLLESSSSRKEEVLKPISSSAQKAFLSPSQHKIDSKPELKVRAATSPYTTKKNRFFEGLEDDELPTRSSGKNFFVPRENPKKLVLPKEQGNTSTVLPLSMSINTSMGSGKGLFGNLQDPSESARSNLTNQFLSASTEVEAQTERSFIAESPVASLSKPTKTPTPNEKLNSVQQNFGVKNPGNVGLFGGQQGQSPSRSALEVSEENSLEISMVTPRNMQEQKENLSSEKRSSSGSKEVSQKPQLIDEGLGIKLRSDYTTKPDIKELNEMLRKTGECIVDDFLIAREGYGNVYFPGKTDLTDIDFDEVVHIRRKEVTIYPDDSVKPPVGEGLNKRAVITLDRVWPMDKSTQQAITSPERLIKMRYHEKIERSTAKVNAKFIDYRPETGSWVFEVKHFSKYSLADDSDDEEAETEGLSDTFLVANPKIMTPADRLLAKSKVKNPSAMSAHFKGLGGGQMEGFSLGNLNGPVFEDTIYEDLSKQDEIDGENFVEGLPMGSYDKLSPSEKTQMRKMQSALFGDLVANENCFSPKQPSINSNRVFEKERNQTINSFQDESKSQMKLNQKVSRMSIRTLGDFAYKAAKKEMLTKMVKDTCEYTPDFEPGFDLSREFSSSGIDSVFTQNGSSAYFKDLGLANAKRFRVCWPKSSEILFPNNRSGNSVPGLFNSKSCASIEAFRFIQPPSTELIANLKELMKTVFDHSTTDFGDCPHYSIHTSPELVIGLSQMEFASQSLMEAVLLCKALFGPLEKPAFNPDSLPGDYEPRQRRREAFSNWLASVASKEDHLLENPKLSSKLAKIFREILLLLTCNDKEAATEIARSNKLSSLAMLTSQEPSFEFQKLMSHTIADWLCNGVCGQLDPTLLKIYALLSGNVTWEAITQEEIDFNACENLRWKRCLGAQLWFCTHQNSSIKDALDQFDQLVFDREIYYSLPFPAYFDPQTERKCEYLDACYHLIKLFIDETYSVELALNPLSYSSDLFDYHPSYIILTVLKSRGFTHIDLERQLSIITNFARQLEQAGIWKWAIFVLCGIESSPARYQAIQNVLDRNCADSFEFTDTELFIVKELRVNPIFVYQGKYVQAIASGNKRLQLHHALKAELFSEAHELLIKGLAGELYFEHENELLINALQSIIPSAIPNWAYEGGAILEFFNLQAARAQIYRESMDVDDQDDEALNRSLTDSLTLICASSIKLAHQLEKFPVKSEVMRMFVSEMCEYCVRNVRLMDKERAITELASRVPAMPMFQDSARCQLALIALATTDQDENPEL